MCGFTVVDQEGPGVVSCFGKRDKRGAVSREDDVGRDRGSKTGE